MGSGATLGALGRWQTHTHPHLRTALLCSILRKRSVEHPRPHCPILLLYGNTMRGNPPKRITDRRRVVQIQVRECLLHGFSGFPGIVVGDLVVDVVHDVRGPDSVMQEVEHWPVGSIDGHESPLSPRPIFLVEVRNIDIGVLKPCVEHQPHVGDCERHAVQKHGRLPPGDEAPCGERDNHRSDAVV